MLELLNYLRERLPDLDLLRRHRRFHAAVVPPTYGFPPQQIIGTTSTLQLRLQGARRRVVGRADGLNDKDVKPVSIDRQIGRRPVIVGGNVLNFGDIAMMEYSKGPKAGRPGPSFQLLVNHDDAAPGVRLRGERQRLADGRARTRLAGGQHQVGLAGGVCTVGREFLSRVF